MKKIFALSVVALTLFAFSSCKKYYTCTCTGAAVGSTAVAYDLGKQTEDDAQSACNALSIGYNPVATCELTQQ